MVDDEERWIVRLIKDRSSARQQELNLSEPAALGKKYFLRPVFAQISSSKMFGTRIQKDQRL